MTMINLLRSLRAMALVTMSVGLIIGGIAIAADWSDALLEGVMYGALVVILGATCLADVLHENRQKALAGRPHQSA